MSGPDLTSVLMDQLGVEMAKEEGFGSGLWAEIKRRHKRVRQHDEDEPEDESVVDGQPEVALVAPSHENVTEVGPAPEAEPAPDAESDVEAGLAAEAEPEQEAADEELDEELDEIWAEYEAPAPVETLEPEAELADDPEPGHFTEPALELVAEPWAAPEPEDVEREAEAEPEVEELDEMWAEYAAPGPLELPDPEPATDPEPEQEFELPELEPAAEAEPEFEPESRDEPEAVEATVPALELVTQPWFPEEPEAGEAGPEPVAAESEETAALRAELEEAREDLARLQGMLADAMTALTALSAETGGAPYAE